MPPSANWRKKSFNLEKCALFSAKKLFLPSFRHSMRPLSDNNLIWCEQVGCDRPVNPTTSQQRISPFCKISFRMRMRYGSATAANAFSINAWSELCMNDGNEPGCFTLNSPRQMKAAIIVMKQVSQTLCLPYHSIST